MNFDVCLIARNEALTLPRLVGSLKEFQARGGNIYVLDTGSTDNTIEVAKGLGCKVEAVGDKFRIKIDKELADKINTKFVVEGESPVVKEGESLFDFASARNYIADFATNDMIATPDCDEIYTKLDLDRIQAEIDKGAEQFEYQFVFSHDGLGNPVIKFMHSKFYNRKKMKWVGVIHEVLSGPAKRVYLDESIIKLEHYQNEKTNRSGYLKGLAIDCFNNPTNDRNSHYFAREMMYHGMNKSAIKEFKNHIAMNCWPTEAAQSMMYVGDCYGALGDTDEMLKWYVKSVEKEARREPLMRLAEYYFRKNMHPQVIVYAEAALAIKQVPFYSNHQPYYENVPHDLLYISYWWFGDKVKSKEHYLKALAFCPKNPKYIADGKFYEGYLDIGIDGFMSQKDLDFLYGQAKKMDSIVEIGSWKGRSTHALLTGCKGPVIAVDNFEGTPGVDLEKSTTIYEDFMKNVGHFPNLKVLKMSSEQAAKQTKKADMVFIDATHTYDEIKKDLKLWKKKATKLICGHDYGTQYPDIKKAVDEEFGDKVKVADLIWYVEL